MSQSKGIKLRVGLYTPSYEYLKLCVRVSNKHQEALGLYNFDHVIVTALSNRCKCAAVIEYTNQITDDTVDITADVRDTLGLSRNDYVYVSGATFEALATLELTQPTGSVKLNPENLLPYLLHRPVTRNGIIYFKSQKLTIVSFTHTGNKVAPNAEYGYVDKNTRLTFVDVISYNPVTSYSELGGVQKELSAIRDVIELPLSYADLFTKLHIKPPKGILLYGPPGVGKTTIGHAIAVATHANFFKINAPEIAEKYYGDSEAKLRGIFEKVMSSPRPAILFIDEADAIMGNRATASSETDQRIVAQLLVLLDGLQKKANAAVIFATNLPDKLDPAFRRGGRIDIEIEFTPPSQAARRDIFRVLLRDTPKRDLDLAQLAKLTNGYVGADINALIKQAGVNCVKSYIRQGGNAPLEITMSHLTDAMKTVQPSILRQHKVMKTKVYFSDVVGLDQEINRIKQSLLYPIKYKALYGKNMLQPIRGILLYGPPGTGKTLLAKALATQLGYKVITVNGPELLSKYVGQTEQTIRSIFRKARYAAPTMIILDEADSLVSNRSDTRTTMSNSPQILGQFLVELNGLTDSANVLLVCTSNRPDLLDAAFLRTGRFDLKVHIPRPKVSALIQLIKYYATRASLQVSDTLAQSLAIRAAAAKMTGADIAGVYKNAMHLAIAEAQLNNRVSPNLEITESHVELAFSRLLDELSVIYRDQKEDYGEMW